MSSGERYRALVATVALDAVGSHYLHGCFGNTPGDPNGHPSRPCTARMVPNQYRTTASTAIVIHTASSPIQGAHYCWGRPEHHDVHSRRDIPLAVLRDPAALQHFAETEPRDQWKWPRTNSGQAGELHFGEACQGVRHFDCIGFVSWVIWKIFGTQTVRDIASCRNYARAEVRQHPELVPGGTPYQPGDILIFSESHIAFALDERWTVEANGENFGLIRGDVRAGITDMLRPNTDLLNRIWNVPRH